MIYTLTKDSTKRPKYLVLMLLTALTGCQAMPKTTTAIANGNTSAEQQLLTALEKTAKSSFSYHTTIRTQAVGLLAKNNELGTVIECNEHHDRQYIALAKKAKEEGLDISADRYLEEKTAIKETFLACQKAQKDSKTDEAALDDGTETSMPIISQIQEDKVYSGKKIKQINEFLLSNATLTAYGNYRPLVGTLTMTPMVRYDFYHAKLMLNQPIYIDLKAGDIYLWADNLALATATTIDKKLGLSWQNKWLKLPLNDGSLPKGFKEDFIKQYLLSQKSKLQESQSRVISFDELPITALSSDEQKAIKQSKAIILSTSTSHHPSIDVFVAQMVEKYPILKETPKPELNSLRFMQALFSYLDKKTQDTHKDPITSAYGIDAKGKIAWHFYQRPIELKSLQLSVLSFTTLSPEVRSDFDRLPASHKKPTPSSSINLFEYGNELKDSLKQSSNLYVRLLAGTLFDADESIEQSVEDVVSDAVSEANSVNESDTLSIED